MWYSREIILYLNLGSNFRLPGFEDTQVEVLKRLSTVNFTDITVCPKTPYRKFLVIEFKSFCIHSGDSHYWPRASERPVQCSVLCIGLYSCCNAINCPSLDDFSVTLALHENVMTLLCSTGYQRYFAEKVKLDFFPILSITGQRHLRIHQSGGCYKTALPQREYPKD